MFFFEEGEVLFVRVEIGLKLIFVLVIQQIVVMLARETWELQ